MAAVVGRSSAIVGFRHVPGSRPGRTAAIALDPQHPCYRLYPHVRFESGATLQEMTGLYTREHMEQVERGIHPPSFEPRWALDVHPAGDPEHLFAPPDFHFVFAARYRVGNFDGLESPGRGPIETETYELLGHRLIAAVERGMDRA